MLQPAVTSRVRPSPRSSRSHQSATRFSKASDTWNHAFVGFGSIGHDGFVGATNGMHSLPIPSPAGDFIPGRHGKDVGRLRLRKRRREREPNPEVGSRESRSMTGHRRTCRADPVSGRRHRDTEPRGGSRRRSRPSPLSFVCTKPRRDELDCVWHSGPRLSLISRKPSAVGRSCPAGTIGRLCDGSSAGRYGRHSASGRSRPSGRPRRLVLAAPGTLRGLFLPFARSASLRLARRPSVSASPEPR